MEKTSAEWLRRAKILQDALIARMQKDVRHDMKPAYVGTYAGAPPTFRESLTKERPSPQQWPHRAFAELLQADMLPPETANLVIDCMRAYGAATIGVVANVERPRQDGRDILGFISYGYAQMLLRLDRVDEYLLFLYAHRFHDHTRGSWVAGEVSGIIGERPLFCIPAQQPFRCWSVACWFWRIPTRKNSISPKPCRAIGWHPEKRFASIRLQRAGAASISAWFPIPTHEPSLPTSGWPGAPHPKKSK
jgi:hypothetical protein